MFYAGPIETLLSWNFSALNLHSISSCELAYNTTSKLSVVRLLALIIWSSSPDPRVLSQDFIHVLALPLLR